MSEIGKALEPLPLVAILRGLEPADAMAVGATLHDACFRIIEVPLNSPEPFESIRMLVESVELNRKYCDVIITLLQSRGCPSALRRFNPTAFREIGHGRSCHGEPWPRKRPL